MKVWAMVSNHLKTKEVAASVVWRHCVELFDSFGSRLSTSESDVLAEVVGFSDDGKLDASLFAHMWERLEPLLLLFRNEQIDFLWRHGHCTLLSDRAAATQALAEPANRKGDCSAHFQHVCRQADRVVAGRIHEQSGPPAGFHRPNTPSFWAKASNARLSKASTTCSCICCRAVMTP